MEVITTAILAALAKLSEPAIRDAYEGLKKLIVGKVGEDHDLVKAVEGLENKPDSPGRKETLREEIELSEATHDPDIINLSRTILDKLKSIPDGQQIINQTVSGNKNILSGSGDVSVNFGRNRE